MALVDTSRFKTDKQGRAYIVVIYGDTLSEIAQAWCNKNGTAYKAPDSYNAIASLNGISDPNHITPGQTIYLTKTASEPNPPRPYTEQGSVKPTVTLFGVLAGGNQPKRIYAVWTWPERTDTAKFEVEWRAYKVGFWTERKDEDVDVDRQHSYYDIPDDKLISKVQFRVRPVPKVDEETARFAQNLWTEWADCTHNVEHKPDIPSKPTAELEALKLTATVDNPGKEKATIIQFQLITDNNLTNAETKKVPVNDDYTTVSHTFNVQTGHSYSVRCRANKGVNYSEWSAISNTVETMPSTVEWVKENPVTPKSSTSIFVQWNKSNTATSYTLEYTDDPEGFYEGVTSTSIDCGEATNRTVNNLKSGLTYHFRVKAVRGEEESDWSEVKTCTIGTSPTAPTIWSSTSTVTRGESVALYWMHNSTDGSSQVTAELKLTFEGVENVTSVAYDVSVGLGKLDDTVIEGNTVTYIVAAATSDVDKDKTHSLIIDTKNYGDGAKITWNVCTTGTTGMASEVSANRVVEIFNKPGIYMTVTDNTTTKDVSDTYYLVDYQEASDVYTKTLDTIEDPKGTPVSGAFVVGTGEQVRVATIDGVETYYCVVEADQSLTAFPFNVNVEVEADSAIHTPIEYHLAIFANERYETVDNFGNPKVVSVGEALYSQHFSASGYDPLEVAITAGDTTLMNGQTYTLKCTVAMSSGLATEAFKEITVSWSKKPYNLNTKIGINTTDWSVSLCPYCSISNTLYHAVSQIGGSYIVSDTTYPFICGTEVNGAITTTGEQVYQGTTAEGTTTYYAIKTEVTPITDVLLSVYRREYDGSFTEIIRDLDASKNSFVTDPHPSLDYARYRIVATDKETSEVTYSDIPNYPIGEKAIIIQWDEPYSSFEVSEDALGLEDRSFSLLRLPYNIDVTNTRDPDVSLVKYIGRKHPVSYYGTQVGEAGSWSTMIPKEDTETIYALQRLQAWTGDVYVREPYGTGYWAHIKVAFSKDHLETTIPVSLDVTRVEGGA